MIICLGASATAQSATPRQPLGRMPITSASPAALALFERAMVSLENLHLEAALQGCRAAVKKDPKFALGHLFISYLASAPAEENAARAQAKALAKAATPGERLLIGWLTGIRENGNAQAMADMNELLTQFPRDKRLVFLAGRWLLLEEQYEQAVKMLERALAVDPNYPAALNVLGYAYAFSQSIDRAAQTMQNYAALIPNQPNPQDSYAEVLRLAGKHAEALEHYRAALKIDPKFYCSQLGIADTYALMGDQQRAREEYAKALQLAGDPAEKVRVSLQSALTWVRERNYDDADQAFQAAAARARTAGMAPLEAQAWRMMAVYQVGHATALRHLDKAEAALQAESTSPSERDEELARILRVRALKAQAAAEPELATKALWRLEQMANAGHSHGVQRAYHATAGALLMVENKFAEAIPHLEQDVANPITMVRLVEAYEQTGDQRAAAAMRERILAANQPTMEQAIVVPVVRAAVSQVKAQ